MSNLHDSTLCWLGSSNPAPWSDALLDALVGAETPAPIALPEPPASDTEESLIAEFCLDNEGEASPPFAEALIEESTHPLPAEAPSSPPQEVALWTPPTPIMPLWPTRFPGLRPLSALERQPPPVDRRPRPTAQPLQLRLNLSVNQRGKGALAMAYSIGGGRILMRSRTVNPVQMVRDLYQERQTYPDLTLICYRQGLADVKVAREQFQRLVQVGLLVKAPTGYREYQLGARVSMDRLQAAIRRHLTEGLDVLAAAGVWTF